MTDETKKPDTILQDGYEVFINKRAITRREWKRLFEPDQPDEEADATVGKMIDKPADYVAGLSINDYQLIINAAFKVVNAPPDPNSPGVSILP